ncbi:MAG: hypothetical protein KBA51_07270 [Kiritimatiellae bacterium]|nr:hypothetical protein [Kiritimatiellia bacterium]
MRDVPSPEQLNIYRRMTPEQKWNQIWALYAAAREFKTAGVRMLHPDWTDEQVQREVRSVFLHAST